MPSLLSECALRSLGLFGLTTDDTRRDSGRREERAAAHAGDIHRTLRPGSLALITGPSAAGKSSILRALATLPDTIAPTRLPRSDTRIAPMHAGAPLQHTSTVIDSLTRAPADLPNALRALSAAGLADAFIPSRPISALSEGERARLVLAHAIHRAQLLIAAARSPTIILDDFADNLDDATAASVSHTLRRWLAHHPAARIIAASVRSHIADALRPDLLIDLADRRGTGFPAHAPDARCQPELAISIARGTLADYHALAGFHYRAGRPGTVARVLTARLEHSIHAGTRLGEPDHPIAVLTISMPTLNGAWRSLAWPRAASSAHSKALAAREINRTLRCISRVIVHPLHRARGVGASLIRHYLADPLTERTEAVSAMGACCPVFNRAGMTEWTLPPAPRDLRLIDALSAANLRPWMLADVDLALDHLSHFPHLDRALRRWATAHGHTRPLAHAPPRDLIRAAAKHIITSRRAYTHG